MPTNPAEQPDRRSFLGRLTLGGAVSVGAVLVPSRRFLPIASAQSGGDEGLAAFAESVELVAVAAYDVGSGLLSEDLAPVLRTFQDHHAEHAEAWAVVADQAAAGEPNEALLAALTPAIEAFSTQHEVLQFARDLENQFAITFGHLLTLLSGDGAVAAAAAILPVEASHAAELSYELDTGPAGWFPSGAFESTDIALGIDPAVFPVT